jgi:hypothetical protein
MIKITQNRLQKLRQSITHATFATIGTAVEATPSEILEDLDAYFHRFADPKKGNDGNIAKGHPCLVCDAPLSPDLAGSLFGEGGFMWGLTHGHGFCRKCRWPAIAYHFIKDRRGNELTTIRGVILQLHPDEIELSR